MYRHDVIRMIANFVLFLIVLLLLSIFVGCRSTRTIETNIRDSVRYETRFVQMVVYDTIQVEIPHQSDAIITRDSISWLENDYAKSLAEVRCGYLRHTLETKPNILKEVVTKEVITKDSIIYKDREVEVERVIVKPLPLWKRALLYFAPILAILCVALFIRLKMK